MTVIAWDGKTLAADRMATLGDMQYRVKKLFTRYVDGETVAFAVSGYFAEGMAMIDWYYKGATGEFPKCADDRKTYLYVARKGKKLEMYENTPVGIEYDEPFCAFGVGREIAMGAMEGMKRAGMQPNAILAVEIANERCVSCGFGYDSHTFN